MCKLHVVAILLGTILEFVFGRMYSIWNPMDSIKRLVTFLDRALLGDEIILLEPDKQRNLGRWLIFLVILPVFSVILFFTLLCYEIAPWLGVLFEAVATYFCLDERRLYYGGLDVMSEFYSDGISSMKQSAGLFMECEEEGDTEAAVSSDVITYIANEASDSVISPLLVLFLFGPVGGFLYRSIDIVDKRIGHKTYRYEYFGEPIARLNTIIDFIPSWFSGVLTVFAAKYTFGDFNGKNARYIHMRDRRKAISAFAGALEIVLADGMIGDEDKHTEAKDIQRAVMLMRNCFLLCQLILVILLLFF
ncbi:MAG: cobalamin biosynthesis protein [Pseudobutyrivibrio sp.]|nr:cobalamin biosynthesis protein [Pseudobutyrivibrio sp.]